LKLILLVTALLLLIISACGEPASDGPIQAEVPSPTPVDRFTLIAGIKITPAEDFWPPTVIEGWSQPEPLPYPISTAGGEDSPFILPDDQILYFFFTPDVSIPAEKQLFDGVTGIWVTHRSGESWSEPMRVWLTGTGKIALDGCPFVLGNSMYYCTAREGFPGLVWFRADFRDGIWQNWRFAGAELEQSKYEVGELHISVDGQELYFGSSRPGGYGGMDLWVSHITDDGWGEPVNLGSLVNTAADESRPFISQDMQELWFTGQSTKGRPGPAVFRSLRQPDETWGVAEEIVSTFAGEPTLSGDGKTLYFVHHFFSEDLSNMLEADIYVSYKTP